MYRTVTTTFAVYAAIGDGIYYHFKIGMFLLTCVSSTRIVGGYVLLVRKRDSVYTAVGDSIYIIFNMLFFLYKTVIRLN